MQEKFTKFDEFCRKVKELERITGASKTDIAAMIGISRQLLYDYLAKKKRISEKSANKLDIALKKAAAAAQNASDATVLDNLRDSKLKALALFPDDMEKADIICGMFRQIYALTREVDDLKKAMAKAFEVPAEKPAAEKLSKVSGKII